MQHIDEKLLELYVLDAEEIKDQRAGIEAHLEECAGCASLHQEMREYYDEVEQIRQERPPTSSEALTLRRMIVRIPPGAKGVPLSQIPRTIPARVVFFIIRHPVVSSISFVAMFLSGLLLMTPKTATRDLNPSYGRAKDEFLVVYNKGGEELWRKHIGISYNDDLKSDAFFHYPEQMIVAVDVDHDGMNEIIGVFGSENIRTDLANAIVCYNADGNVRWNYPFHRQVTFGPTQYSDDYRFRLVTAEDYAHKGTVEVIGVAYHWPWIPNAVVRLDASNGSFLGEYWHFGKIGCMIANDVNKNGVQELLFGGKNSGFNRGYLTILDPRFIGGCAPVPPEDVPNGIRPGTEKYYILFPASDLEKFWTESNQVRSITISEKGGLDVAVHEQMLILERGSEGGELHYFFDSSMTCVKMLASNDFVSTHKKFELEGKATRMIDDRYFEDMRKGVQYWDGEKFVHEPTMNKYYLEATRNKSLP